MHKLENIYSTAKVEGNDKDESKGSVIRRGDLRTRVIARAGASVRTMLSIESGGKGQGREKGKYTVDGKVK